jgi:TonB family protein
MSLPLVHGRLNSSRLIVGTVAAAILVLLTGSSSGLIPNLYAQNKTKPSREVIHTVKPDYPAIVKNARIGGTVRLNALVLQNGTVARIQIVGGNPILAESTAKAVMSWKYAPAASQTSEEVVVIFNSNELH